MRTYREEGFTLVELLVVIAIIGILATLMFPAISSALEKANSTKMANSGTAIAKSIFQENIEREAQNDGTIWCGDQFTIYDEMGTKVEFNTEFTSAAEYFSALIKNGVVEGLTSYGYFAGAGVPQPKGEDDLTTDKNYNVWSIVSVTEGTVYGDAPFIFTRNLLPDNLAKDLKDNQIIDSENRWPATNTEIWDPSKKPFGTSRCIVITRGGAALQTRSRDMTPQRFWGDSKFSSVAGVKPLPAQK